MASQKALITPSVLQWAIKRAGISADSIHKKAKEWLAGEAYPTFNQAIEVAKKLQIPFGYLWLNEPPVEPVEQGIIPDLRTINNLTNPELSLELRTTISDMLNKQEWYKEYITSNEFHLSKVVGNFSIDNDKTKIVNDILNKFKLDELIGKKIDRDLMFKKLIEKAENLGILVMRNSILRNNTKKSLDIKEFRGFAIYDDFAPLIFINTKDAKSAQIFTFFHEIAHLWIGKGGISDSSSYMPENEIELFCNEVAAMILMPENDIKAQAKDIGYSAHDQLIKLADIFSVSTFAILNRLRNLGILQASEYKNLYESEMQIFENIPPKKQQGAPSPEILIKMRNGALFSSAVIADVMQGKESFTAGMRLLGINNTNMLEKLGIELKILGIKG